MAAPMTLTWRTAPRRCCSPMRSPTCPGQGGTGWPASPRARPPVRMRLPGAAVTGLAASTAVIPAILSDPGSFGSNGFQLPDPASGAARGFSADRDGRHGNITVYDPPDHARLRAMIVPAFSARRMTAMEPLVRHFAAERLEAMARSGPPAD